MVDARYNNIKGSLSGLEQEIIVSFGHILDDYIKDPNAPKKQDYISAFCRYSSLSPEIVEAVVDRLLDKEYLGLVFEDHIFLNVVGLPCENN